MEHFQNPRNTGEIENPDGYGEVGNPYCGDMIKLYIRVKDNIVADIKFKTFGCAAAIATSSIFTELVMGKTLDEAAKLTSDNVVEFLGGLPEEKVHCSILAPDALQAAIKDYRSK